MNNYKSFLDRILANKELMVDRLIKWASINSGSYNYEGLGEMLDALVEDFSVLPGRVEIVQLSDDPALPKALRMVNRPEAPIQILFNGHMDTVYGKEHSFQVCSKVSDNVLQGPGVADMKGGLVIMLEVLKVFEETPWAKNIGWEVLIVPDEEIGSVYSAPLLETAAKRYSLGLIFEPSLPDGSLVRSRKGSGVFTVVAHGKAGHAGRDFNREDNAIVGLCRFISSVNELNVEFPKAIFNVGHIEGGGTLNIVPDHALAKISVRMNSFEERANIERRFSELVEFANKEHKVQIESSVSYSRPPKPYSESAEVLFHELEACGNELGMALSWEDTGGASDGNNLAAAGLPNIDNLGVHGNDIHSDREHVFLESLTERAQLVTLFLLKLASGSISLPQQFFPNQRYVQ